MHVQHDVGCAGPCVCFHLQCRKQTICACLASPLARVPECIVVATPFFARGSICRRLLDVSAPKPLIAIVASSALLCFKGSIECIAPMLQDCWLRALPYRSY